MKTPKLFTATFILALITTILTGIKPASAATCPALPTATGTAAASITIPANGTYRIWAHLYAPSSSNNSFYLQIVGTSYCQITVGGGSGTPGGAFTWVDYQNGSSTNLMNVTLDKGNYTLNMAGVTPGVGVDKLFLTGDTNCIPTGDGSNCESASNTASPVSDPNLTIVSIGGTNNTQVTVTGVIRFVTPLAPFNSKVVYSVDRKILDGDTLNTSTLAAGKHTVTSTITNSQTGKKTTYTRVIDVALTATKSRPRSISTLEILGSAVAVLIIISSIGYVVFRYLRHPSSTAPLASEPPTPNTPVVMSSQVVTPTTPVPPATDNNPSENQKE
ncbi:MAG TPA: hypothetical protein VMB52_05500 [Verrucomicrobiae bacterium]|nr:hypothetical protein [Verrucomicrobiae bacterium]